MNLKIPLLLIVFTLVLCSCSSESESEPVSEQPQQLIEVTLQGFEQEYAYVDDEVTLLGTNFPTNTSLIKITLDNIETEVLSATQTTLVFSIPEGTSTTPLVAVEIPNADISFSDTYKPVAIVNNTKGEWLFTDFYVESINAIRNIQATGKEELYFSTEEKSTDGDGKGLMKVHQTLNGGISIAFFNQNYVFSADNGDFLIGPKGGEFLLGSNYLSYVRKDGTQTIFEDFPSTINSWTRGLYTNSSEQRIIIGSGEGRIYKSIDGAQSFEMVHEQASNSYEFLTFYAHSEDEVWLAGYTFPFPENLDYYPAKQLRLKDGTWQEDAIRIEQGNRTREIVERLKFIDGNTGFASARIVNMDTGAEKFVLLKSTTRGDNWEIIKEDVSFIEDFTFKNLNEGWYVSGNEVYATTDGGSNWELMYANDTACKGILYNEEILWVIADSKLLKYYF